MSSKITPPPLKGIPFAHPAKPKPVHLKGLPQNDAGPSREANTAPGEVSIRDIGFDSSDDRGFLDFVWGSNQPAAEVLPEPTRFRLGSTTIEGHLASDLKHAAYPSGRYEIRTFMPTREGEVACLDFRQLLEAVRIPSPPSQHYVISGQQVQQAVERTGAERQRQLDDLGQLTWGDRVVPKDATLNPGDVTMFLRSTSDVSVTYARQLSQIGQIEGFHVVAGITGRKESYQRALDGYQNVSLMEIPHGEVWTEDYSEPTLGGGQVVPAIFDDHYGGLISEAIREGRAQRYKGTGLSGDFAYHGAVNQGKFQKAALARGLASEGKLRQALSYLEGGNIYTGTRPDGEGYVLVGKDSWHVTRRLLEKQTGREWSEEEVAKVVAADLGLKSENVVPVEQPGAFHLDMRMTAIAPGVMLLNDSVAAAEQQIRWLKDDIQRQLDAGSLTPQQAEKHLRQVDKHAQAMMERAREMAGYETLTARDLEQAGFTVHRMGGAFVEVGNPKRDTANYFNARHGTNENGERFSILMGGRPQEEAFVAQQIMKLSEGSISRIHFLDPSVTQATLDLWGGLKCRTKPEGDLVSPELIASPNQSQVSAG